MRRNCSPTTRSSPSIPIGWLLDDDQVELLERWVAEKAGGLIVIAGPVETDRWVSDPRMAKIRGLYPVEFSRRLTLMEEGRFGSETVWPLHFTREGLDAEFLWLADNASASEQAWASFPGVYGYYGVHGAKPGATVYARYSDPESASAGQLPVYMAGHFYGSGRVFYLGSGEMWRHAGRQRIVLRGDLYQARAPRLARPIARRIEPRHVVGRSRSLRAGRNRPGPRAIVRLAVRAVGAPQVPLAIVQPDGTLETLPLAADPQRKGMFAGQFTALKEGTYRLELAGPRRRRTTGAADSSQGSRIGTRTSRAQRRACSATWPTRPAATITSAPTRSWATAGLPELAGQLPDRTETTYLSGVKDLDFEGRWMWTLLALIAGALFLEWTLRRLVKLA